ncbi:uncharacterized protein LOC134533566 [Bacillus rossius redtenbacheri]|uniref:uncharacterized protein LOC134533566 n=1 Tax=Bacillus rossius redtenbacheri TaxID=93214 RepID=UPI002FDD80A2
MRLSKMFSKTVGGSQQQEAGAMITSDAVVAGKSSVGMPYYIQPHSLPQVDHYSLPTRAELSKKIQNHRGVDITNKSDAVVTGKSCVGASQMDSRPESTQAELCEKIRQHWGVVDTNKSDAMVAGKLSVGIPYYVQPHSLPQVDHQPETTQADYSEKIQPPGGVGDTKKSDAVVAGKLSVGIPYYVQPHSLPQVDHQPEPTQADYSEKIQPPGGVGDTKKSDSVVSGKLSVGTPYYVQPHSLPQVIPQTEPTQADLLERIKQYRRVADTKKSDAVVTGKLSVGKPSYVQPPSSSLMDPQADLAKKIQQLRGVDVTKKSDAVVPQVDVQAELPRATMPKQRQPLPKDTHRGTPGGRGERCLAARTAPGRSRPREPQLSPPGRPGRSRQVPMVTMHRPIISVTLSSFFL